MRVIVGISGATGIIYGIRLLERLREASVETHLVMSRWGGRTLLHETSYTREQVEALADDVGTVLAPTDYERAAEGLGARGLLLVDASRVDDVLREAVALARSGRPVYVNARIGRTDFRKGSISM